MRAIVYVNSLSNAFTFYNARAVYADENVRILRAAVEGDDLVVHVKMDGEPSFAQYGAFIAVRVWTPRAD